MEEDIQNYSPIVMFGGTPCMSLQFSLYITYQEVPCQELEFLILKIYFVNIYKNR